MWWATHASVALSADGDTDAGILAGLATVYVAEGDSGNFVETDAGRWRTHRVRQSVVRHARYRVKVSLVGDPAVACEPVSFVTETMAGVPKRRLRAADENHRDESAAGRKLDHDLGRQAFQDVHGYVGVRAAGMGVYKRQDLLSGAATANSWYQIPSVYNSTLSWCRISPRAKILSIGQSAYDEYPAVYQNIPVASG